MLEPQDQLRAWMALIGGIGLLGMLLYYGYSQAVRDMPRFHTLIAALAGALIGGALVALVLHLLSRMA